MSKVKPLYHGTKTTLRKKRRTDKRTIKLRPLGISTIKLRRLRPTRTRTRTRTIRSRRLFKGKRPPLPVLLIAIVACLGIFTCLFAQTVTTLVNDHLQYTQKIQPSGPYILTGKPTINADFINEVLAYYHSPAQGKGQTLYDDGVKYHIDPAFALAFFMHESDLGTQGVARYTHSLGNIRATKGYAQYEGYRKYSSWEEGFADWYQLIANLYIQQWGLTSIDQIIPVYAPTADNNNEAQYIYAVKYMVATWRTGQVAVSW
jgi:Muramidase (flagellum-specific)